MMKADGFEDAILGVCRRKGQADTVLYDQDTVIKILMDDGLDYEEAVEYYENNIIGAWVGEGTPCLLYTSPSPRDGLLSRMPSSA